jgi:hypothetical protein
MQSYTETIAELAKGMFNVTYAANTPCVLYGCVKTSLGGSDYSYSEGAIFYNGEVYSFPAVAAISITTSDVCTITTTNDPTADPTTKSDGSVVNIHNIRAIVLSNASSVTNGATQFNFSSIQKLAKEKTIDIGDWNMDSTTSITVAHSITGFDPKNIISVNVWIREDDYPGGLYGTSLINLFSGVTPNGQVSIVSSTEVYLSRASGGLFDAAGFDSTSFNRGFITIRYYL